jgi:hypothetical protein
MDIVGVITDDVLAEFVAKTPGTRICTCMDFSPELTDSGDTWAGGQHLMSPVPGTQEVQTHYYPDRSTKTITMLLITGSK